MAVAPLQRSPSGSEWTDRHEKCFGKTCLNFQWNLNTVDKNLKDWSPVNLGAVPRKLFADIYWRKTFSFLCAQLTLEVLPDLLNAACVLSSRCCVSPSLTLGRRCGPSKSNEETKRKLNSETLRSRGSDGSCVSRHSQETRRQFEDALRING